MSCRIQVILIVVFRRSDFFSIRMPQRQCHCCDQEILPLNLYFKEKKLFDFITKKNRLLKLLIPSHIVVFYRNGFYIAPQSCKMFNSFGIPSFLSHSCANKSASPVPCGLGSYSPAGMAQCPDCSAGQYCPITTAAAPIACPTGYYNILTKQSSCTICPRGLLFYSFANLKTLIEGMF